MGSRSGKGTSEIMKSRSPFEDFPPLDMVAFRKGSMPKQDPNVSCFVPKLHTNDSTSERDGTERQQRNSISTSQTKTHISVRHASDVHDGWSPVEKGPPEARAREPGAGRSGATFLRSLSAAPFPLLSRLLGTTPLVLHAQQAALHLLVPFFFRENGGGSRSVFCARHGLCRVRVGGQAV